MRRRSSRIRLVLLATMAVIAAACGGSAATEVDQTTTTIAPIETDVVETTTTLAPAEIGGDAGAAVVNALEATAAVESAKYEGRVTVTPGDDEPDLEEFVLAFDGAFAGTDTFSMRIDLSSLLDAAGEETDELGAFAAMLGAMEVRVVDGVTYISAPFFTMFTGYEWIAAPEDDTDSIADGFTGGATPGNPADTLTMLRDLDPNAVVVGRESVRGVETTHYSAIIDRETIKALSDAERREVEDALGESGIEEIPFDVWIDDDGFLRRYEMFLDISEEDLGDSEMPTGSMRMVMEMFDINEPIDVAAPPADEIAPEDAFANMFEGFGDVLGDLEGFGELEGSEDGN